MKRVLITGVAGMIGSHLLDALLEKGYKVIGIDNLKFGNLENIKGVLKNKNFKFIKADILNFETLNNAVKDIDIIVHLAAAKKIGEDGDSFNTLRINAQGTRNVLEAAKKKKIKVIYASTSDVYGLSQDLPFKEDGNLVIGPPTAKRWAYALSKIYGEQLSFAYYKEFNVPIVILRYFGGFSPRSSSTWSGGHIPLFIDAILNDKEVIIHGDGKQTRSMAYVDDLVNGTILAMENPKAVGNIFNIGNKEEMRVIEAAYLIKKLAGKKKIKIKFVPFKRVFGDYKEIMRRLPDLSKARQILGYRPKVHIREGLKRVLEYRMQHIKSGIKFHR